MTMIAMSRLLQVVAEADRLSSEFSGPPIPVHEIAERNGVNVVIAESSLPISAIPATLFPDTANSKRTGCT